MLRREGALVLERPGWSLTISGGKDLMTVETIVLHDEARTASTVTLNADEVDRLYTFLCSQMKRKAESYEDVKSDLKWFFDRRR